MDKRPGRPISTDARPIQRHLPTAAAWSPERCRVPLASRSLASRSEEEHANSFLLAHLPAREADPLRAARPSLTAGVTALLHSLRSRDDRLYRHSLKVHALVASLLPALPLPSEEAIAIEAAALLHDIGKLYLPRDLLQKASALTPAEFEQVKQHCLQGALLLNRMALPITMIRCVYHHHERWDGSGYPLGLAGPAIPLGARLIAIADAFEVMTGGRPYQQARPALEAVEELYAHAGSQFDPALVELFYHTQITPHPCGRCCCFSRSAGASVAGDPPDQTACAADEYRDGAALRERDHPRR